MEGKDGSQWNIYISEETKMVTNNRFCLWLRLGVKMLVW